MDTKYRNKEVDDESAERKRSFQNSLAINAAFSQYAGDTLASVLVYKE